jgi:hypothetical protein
VSRDYLLKVYFDKAYPNEKVQSFFVKWCGLSQILKIGTSSVICEMGCSGGVSPEDTMNNLYKSLNKNGLKTSKDNIIAWSLHPDKAIIIVGEEK